eukprot:698105-Lingulodinium_polyedra.AAC.1
MRKAPISETIGAAGCGGGGGDIAGRTRAEGAGDSASARTAGASAAAGAGDSAPGRPAVGRDGAGLGTRTAAE